MSAPLSPTQRFYRTLIPGVVVGTILIGVPIQWFGLHFELGLMFGTLYAHLGIAALLSCWGPGTIRERMIASVCMFMLSLGSILAHTIYRDFFEDTLGIILSCLAQYLLLAGFYGGFRSLYGLRLQHHTSPARTFGPSDRQFGIKQLLLLMVAVSLLLAAGRAVIALRVMESLIKIDREVPVFLYLSMAAVVMTALLSIAILLRRSLAVIAVPLVILFMVGVTLLELRMMNALSIQRGPDEWHFLGINGFMAAWTVVYLVLFRAIGFQLAAPPIEPLPDNFHGATAAVQRGE